MLHVRRVGHGSICLYPKNDFVKRQKTESDSDQTLMVSNNIFSTAVTEDGDDWT